MEFFNNAGKPIEGLDAWKRLAPPASSDHWVEGRSALELARSWSEGDGTVRATEVLRLAPGLAGATLLEGHAERKTQFDKISRGKRNHDLLVSGTTEAGPLVVGVEGKADETFDRTVDQYAKAVRSPESEAPERLRSLTQALFGTTPEQDPTLGTLRYQLLSALAGTLADAKTYDAADAVLLVHEFVTPKTDDRNHEKNAADLEAFVGRLFPAGTPRERLGESWITGPTTIVSTGEWFPNEISLYVAKLVTHAGR